MNVQQLIEKLATFDPDAPVYVSVSSDGFTMIPAEVKELGSYEDSRPPGRTHGALVIGVKTDR